MCGCCCFVVVFSSSFFFLSFFLCFLVFFSFLNSILLHACLQILLIICNRCVPVMPFLFSCSPESEWDHKPVNLLVRLCVLQILTAANGLTEVLFFFLLVCCSSVWSPTQSEWRLKTWVSNQHSKHSVFSLFFCLVCVPAFGRMSALLHETSISSPMGVGGSGGGGVHQARATIVHAIKRAQNILLDSEVRSCVKVDGDVLGPSPL